MLEVMDTDSSNITKLNMPVEYLHVQQNQMQEELPGLHVNGPSMNDCLLFNFVLDTIITGTLCLVGFAGNVLSFIVLWQEKSHVSIMFLLEALVIADLTVIWMIFLQDVVPGLAYVVPILHDCTHACQYIGHVTRPLLYVAIACVAWFTVAAAVNRYTITCSPSHAPLICTLEFARKQVICITAVATILAIPLTFDSTLQVSLPIENVATGTLFNFKYYQYIYLNGILFFIVLVLPLLCVTVVCLKLVHVLNSIKRMRRALASLYKAQNTEMSQVILTLSITLFVCYVPSTIKCILQWTQTEFLEPCGHLNFYLDSFCKLFLALNSAMKILIFSLFAQRFWETLKQVLCMRYNKSSELEIFGMYKCADMSEMTLMSDVGNHS